MALNLNLDTILNIIGLAMAILSPILGALSAYYNHYNYSWKKIGAAIKILTSKVN